MGRSLLLLLLLEVSIWADGKMVIVPVLVQLGSDQACLVGMNVALLLGLSFLGANGRPCDVFQAKITHFPTIMMGPSWSICLLVLSPAEAELWSHSAWW